MCRAAWCGKTPASSNPILLSPAWSAGVNKIKVDNKDDPFFFLY